MIKERPILFSGPMVRAILEGRKTMTRRVIKKQCEHSEIGCDGIGVFVHRHCAHDTGITRCPHGNVGDRLWVRETFAESQNGTLYRADPMFDGMNTGDFSWNWKPSIFMPRNLSRITLELASVRVERLNDISEEDAKAEGINEYEFYPDDGYPLCLGYTHEVEDKNTACLLYNTRVKAFTNLWEKINGLGSWDANPWVWVEEFKRVEV